MKTNRLFCSIFLVSTAILLTGTQAYASTRTAELNGFQAIPANLSPAAGTGSVLLNSAETQVTVTLYFLGLAGAQTGAAIHGPALPGAAGPVILDLPLGNFSQTFAVTPQQASDLKSGLWYIQVRSSAFPSGEIRGQLSNTVVTAVPFPTSSGALDTTFGTGGQVTTQVGPTNEVAQAIAIQPDGKIVVAGFGSNGTNNDFAVVRYNPDGSLDEGFDGASNGNGIVLAPIGTSEDEAFGVALQPDGKIVLAGQTIDGATTNIAVARFNSNGTLDNTFDGDGYATVVRSGSGIARSVAIQADGKIVVAGNIVIGTNSDIAIIRFDANGSLDATFDGNTGNANGVVTTTVGSGSDIGYGVAIQPDGRIVVSGYFSGPVSTDTAILRYNADGRLDTTFSGDGIFTNAFSPNNTDEALSVALQGDGKIVFAGCIRTTGANDFLFARINADGTLDTSFGTAGSLTVAFSSSADIGLGVAVQSDGKIIGSGFGTNGSDFDFAIARLNPNGTLDTTFDDDGKVQTRFGAFTDSANAVAIQADGKIVAAGRAVGATADFGVVRYGYGSNAAGNDGFIDLNPTTAVRFDNATRPGVSSAINVNSAALPPLPAGWAFVGQSRSLHTSAQFSGQVNVRLTLPESLSLESFNAVRIFEYDNGSWVDKTATAPPRDFASRSVYATVSSLSVLAAVAPVGIAAAPSAITGRLLTADGKAVSPPVVVSITNAAGSTSYASTNPFGYFRFTNLPATERYVLAARSKGSGFPPQLVSTGSDTMDILLPAVP